MAVRQIDGGNKIIDILHGLGHCSSHSSVLRHDTALGEKSLKSGTELPKSVMKDQMATLVIDNADFGEENKTQTHVMNMILLQNSHFPFVSPQESPMKRSLRKSMEAPQVEIKEYRLVKKKSPVFDTFLQIDLVDSPHAHSIKADLYDIFYILTKYFGTRQSIPDWTGFNTLLSKPRNKTTVTYLPIIDALIIDPPNFLQYIRQ